MSPRVLPRCCFGLAIALVVSPALAQERSSPDRFLAWLATWSARAEVCAKRESEADRARAWEVGREIDEWVEKALAGEEGRLVWWGSMKKEILASSRFAPECSEGERSELEGILADLKGSPPEDFARDALR